MPGRRQTRQVKSFSVRQTRGTPRNEGLWTTDIKIKPNRESCWWCLLVLSVGNGDFYQFERLYQHSWSKLQWFPATTQEKKQKQKKQQPAKWAIYLLFQFQIRSMLPVPLKHNRSYSEIVKHFRIGLFDSLEQKKLSLSMDLDLSKKWKYTGFITVKMSIWHFMSHEMSRWDVLCDVEKNYYNSWISFI